MNAALVLTLFGGTAVANDPEPQLPKLEDLERHTTPATGTASEPARPMPPAVTICIDRTARRCWSAVRQNECRERSADGAVYRVLDNRPDGGAGQALTACWAEVDGR